MRRCPVIDPAYFEFSCQVQLVAGDRALEGIPALLAPHGGRRPMVLTDAGVKSAGLLEILLSALALAATLAGMAFSNSMVGMVHCLGHSVGGVCGVAHGTCMGILLPYGMEYNRHKAPQIMGDLLLPLAGPEIFTTTAPKNRAQEAVAQVRALNQALHQATQGRHPVRFKDCLGPDGSPAVPRESIPAIADTALGDGSLMYNPEDMDRTDFITVLEAAWEGRPLFAKENGI